ncbi:MAG: Gfo/Idh/MocA family oxidoreductase [Acidobacteriaceae bacterium]
MVRVAIVGLGKMGLSHLAMIRVHPQVELVGVCDTSKFLLDIIGKYTGVATFTDHERMFRESSPEAIIVATPSRFHASIVRASLERGLHIFCEKPFCLDWEESTALASLAEERGLVNQVGYHYRFVGSFQEVKRLISSGAIGTVSHVLAEAYGPVVLRSKAMSWRTQKEEGGGCLYDYAAHPVNLLNWLFGCPKVIGEAEMNSIFSRDIDDEVYSSMRFDGGPGVHLSVNWSDESYRKMSVKLTLWGSTGRIYADRQECQVFLRNTAAVPDGYVAGWNVRYTTDLTQPVWFYLRGEEYSAQLDHFVQCIVSNNRDNVNSFTSAAETDRVLAMIRHRGESATAIRPPEERAGISRLFRH